MNISNVNNTSNIHTVAKNSNETQGLNENSFDSFLKGKTPREISYDEYKNLSRDDLKKLFTNEDEFSKANKLRMTAINSADDTLGKILFEKQISETNSKADEFAVFDISGSIHIIKFIELGLKYGEIIGERVSKLVNNFNMDVHDAFEYVSSEDAVNVQKEYDYLLEDMKFTPEEYFAYIEKRINFTKQLIQDEKDGIRVDAPTEYENYIDEIEAIHRGIKSEYEKKINDEKSIEEYYKLDKNSINNINL